MSVFWPVVALIFLLFATIVTSNPVATPHNLHSRQSGIGLVSGLSWRDENGNVPVRREIRDLKDNFPDQWTLYLLGLSSLQWLDQEDQLSYYGLASIHGRPFRTWGDAPGIPSKIGTGGLLPSQQPPLSPMAPTLSCSLRGDHSRICTQFSRLIFSQEELYKRVQYYASEASEDEYERFQTAANSFRMPYWDWALGESGGPVPDIFTTQMIDIVRPNGSEQELWNPLYSFYFHPLVPEDFESKWSTMNATLRWPNTDTFNAVSDEAAMQASFKQQQRGLHDQIDRAFRANTIDAFGKLVEDAHGWVHGVIGGGWDSKSPAGHMWPLEYSAYEPMFMLHHTNVDRLYAMYQAAHPDRPFESANIGSNGNVWLENGAIVDGDTGMLPFRKSSGDFWTPNDVKSTETFGYAYPETFKDVPHAAEDEEETGGDEWEEDWDFAAIATASIARLYSSSARDMLTADSATAGGSTLLALNGTFTDWAIATGALTHKLPSTFVVRFYLTSDFSSDPSVDVGSWVNIMPSSHEQTRKRAAVIETTYNSSISLTSSLLDQIKAGRLESLEEKDVIPYLTEKLSWRVVKGDGTTMPQTELGALTFEVVSTQAHIPSDATKPIQYSEVVLKHPEVTRGKAGGVVA